MKQQTMTASATIADAAATCTDGGKKTCDDRLLVRKLMQISGKRLLPRLGVSPTNSPIPHTAEPWMSPETQATKSRLDQVMRRCGFRQGATLGGRSSLCNNQSLILCAVGTKSHCVEVSTPVKTKCRGKVRTGFPRRDWAH